MATVDSPASLDSIPNELLLEICSYLQPIRGFLSSTPDEAARQEQNSLRSKALHDLSVTSTRFHGITQPFLYQTLVLGTEARTKTSKYLESVVRRPTLAKYLQYLECTYDGYEECPNGEAVELNSWLHEKQWELVRRLSSDITSNDAALQDASSKTSRSLTQINALTQPIKLALLVSLSPNLVDFAFIRPQDLIYPEFTSCSVTYLISEVAPGVLPKVERLWLGPFDSGDVRKSPSSTSRNLFRHFFKSAVQTPTLKSISLVQNAAWLNAERFLSERTLSIEVIDLDVCELPCTDLIALIESPRSLRRFSCRWGAKTGLPRAVYLYLIRDALLSQKSSLEHLLIDTLNSDYLVDMDAVFPPLGSLREFECLTRLEVSGIALFGDADGDGEYQQVRLSEILPESLVDLVIWDEWDDDIENAFWTLAGDLPQPLPNLKTIDCTWRPATGETAAMLPAQFAEHGVELRLNFEKE